VIVVFETLVMRHYTSLGKVRKRGSVGERLIRRQLDLGVGPQSLLFLRGFLEAVQGRTSGPELLVDKSQIDPFVLNKPTPPLPN